MQTLEKTWLKQAILEIPDLPTLPSNVLLLMELLRDAKAPASEAINQIEQDHVLAAQVLKLVNSSYYSHVYGVNSIGHAVSVLGYREIWNLLLGSSAMEMISANDLNLWLHSYTASLLMKEMVEVEKLRCSPKIQLAMLMHDIGKVALLNYDLEAYRRVQTLFSKDGVMAHTIEEAQLGLNHAEVGAWLLEGWGLDEELVIPIAQHHCCEIPDQYATETILIKLVDYLDHTARGHCCLPPEWDELEHIGLGHFDVESWLEQHAAHIEELKLIDLPDLPDLADRPDRPALGANARRY